jgi:hypothetical protein
MSRKRLGLAAATIAPLLLSLSLAQAGGTRGRVPGRHPSVVRARAMLCAQVADLDGPGREGAQVLARHLEQTLGEAEAEGRVLSADHLASKDGQFADITYLDRDGVYHSIRVAEGEEFTPRSDGGHDIRRLTHDMQGTERKIAVASDSHRVETQYQMQDGTLVTRILRRYGADRVPVRFDQDGTLQMKTTRTTTEMHEVRVAE